MWINKLISPTAKLPFHLPLFFSLNIVFAIATKILRAISDRAPSGSLPKICALILLKKWRAFSKPGSRYHQIRVPYPITSCITRHV
ncbi:hypothetical protein C8Q75DRAFT_762506 [Abortiporus biennis]|nr:hypothetical protein C8Q75DRAFT_762506 [Abortiporus biennis]